MMLLQKLVCLPAEGTYGHDVWTSRVEFCENLVNVSHQWNDRANLGLTVQKKRMNH